jgi:crotonobetainyl-CoA:carnitine CoA-transferase CaiB-like acyl-CoA transferase
MTTAGSALEVVWRLGMGGDASRPPCVETGPDEVLPSVFPVTEAAAAAIGASSSAAARLLQLRTGRSEAPVVGVDRRHAAIAFRSERSVTVNGARPSGGWDGLGGNYRTADGRWLLLHVNMPAHRERALELLGAEPDRESVAAAIGRWDGLALEDALAAAGACGAVMRTVDEWRAHPHAVAMSELPPIEVTRIGAGPPNELVSADRAAAGIKVLDFTRVIAGPLCGRTLASHGAEVLRIGAPHLYDSPTLVVITGFGKRSAFVDLRDRHGVELIHRLVEQADVVVQGYRPGTLATRGLGPDELTAIRPGLVYVNISAFGRAGPWSQRRGYDSIVQMASGIAAAGAEAAGADDPRPLPAQALDHGTGYLAAFGALAGLCRQAQEGGSWLVELSLAQTSAWIQGLGRIDSLALAPPAAEEVAAFTDEMDSPFGRVGYVRPASTIDGAAPFWTTPPVPLGSDPPRWP